MAKTKATARKPARKKSPRKNSLLGKRFRYSYADTNPLWEVVRSRGRGAYDCVVVDEPVVIDGVTYEGDYVGTRRVFGAAEIRKALQIEAFWHKHRDADEAFYEGLQIGRTVHYHNGFGRYIRCEVVKPGDDVCLKKLALVGPWSSYDLHPTGHHVTGITRGELFRPLATNIWENPAFQKGFGPAHEDPTKQAPIELPTTLRVVVHWPDFDEAGQIIELSADKIRVAIDGEDFPFTFLRVEGGWVEQDANSVIQISGLEAR